MTYPHQSQYSAAGTPDPSAVWARPGTRQHVAKLGLSVVLLLFFAMLSVNAWFAGDFDDSATEKVIGTVITFGCVLTTLFGIVAGVGVLRNRDKAAAVAVDQHGIWWVFQQHATLTSWQEIYAVGVGYKIPPRITAYSGSPIRRTQDYALEVFLREPGVPDQRAALQHWDCDDDPSHPSLPRRRLRYVLPVSGVRKELSQVVGHYAPQLWIGVYERRWTRIPGK